MNDVQNEHKQEQKKSPAVKAAAVILFLIIIVFCAWAAVRLAMLLPTAFNSLASLADSVYRHNPTEITLNTDMQTDTAKSDESVTINWNDTKSEGQYTFAYECIDGVSATVNIDGDVYDVDCGDPFYLPANTFSIDARFASEKMRVAYVPFIITFIPDDTDVAPIDSRTTLTITNGDIPDRVTQNDTEDETATDDKTNDTNTDTATTTPQYKTVKVYRYALPESDPNGYTDLRVTFRAVGTINSAGTFSPRTTLDSHENGAFQFVVKNVGTKTSSDWHFTGITPANTEFDSGSQTGLKPNEEATLTIGFENTGSSGRRPVSVTVNGGNDINTGNNSFVTYVTVR